MLLKISITILAAALVLGSGHAEENAKPADITSQVLLTAIAATKEIGQIGLDQQNKAKALEKLSKFEYSAALRPKLKEVFGTERPLALERVAGAKGRINYAARLLPHTYQEAGGQEVSWAVLTLKVGTDTAGRSLVLDADWPSLDIGLGAEAIQHRNIRATMRQRLGYQGLWYGVADVRVGSIAIAGGVTASADVNVQGREEVKRTASVGPLRMDGLVASAEMKQRGKLVDFISRFGIDTLEVAGEKVERIRVDSSLVGLDAAVLARYQKDAAALQARTDLAPDQVTAEVLKQLKAVAGSMVERGVAIKLDNIGASYHGQAFSLKGSVAFDHALASDLDEPVRLARKMVARLDMRVPLALVREIALTVARKQGGEESQVQLNAKQITDVVIGKLVGGGFASLQNDELRSLIEINHGRLTFNGKLVELPNMASEDIFGQRSDALELPGLCNWPAEPPVSKPAELVLTYVIDKEGRAQHVVIVKPSGLAEFDSATAAAAKSCRWKPAMQGRTPLPSNVKRSVTLTPIGGKDQLVKPVTPVPVSPPAPQK